jgi:hypothetical protein
MPLQPGSQLGTAGHMSPEQAPARPRTGDRILGRFRVILFEMLTGAAPAMARPEKDSESRRNAMAWGQSEKGDFDENV